LFKLNFCGGNFLDLAKPQVNMSEFGNLFCAFNHVSNLWLELEDMLHALQLEPAHLKKWLCYNPLIFL